MFKIHYQKGDRIVYGMSGICEVEGIKSLSLSREKPKTMYYILKPLSNAGSTIFVPCDNEALRAKMRNILSKDEIDHILAQAKGKQMAWIDDRRLRSENFHEILSKGIRNELLLLISCIYLKKQELHACGKKLSSDDEAILQSGQKLVEEEFSCALHTKPEEVGKYIRTALGINN